MVDPDGNLYDPFADKVQAISGIAFVENFLPMLQGLLRNYTPQEPEIIGSQSGEQVVCLKGQHGPDHRMVPGKDKA
ncbi:hypothetical protein SDC9_134972 [bioreactor metagenome]|uniref:Uncharacterized protein n=1 Tax=bioreactor metagenome TaxID=1076179 RepID=A0A645DH10_9ZZZZ